MRELVLARRASDLRLQVLELGLQHLDAGLGLGQRGTGPGLIRGRGSLGVDAERTTATPLAIASSTAPDTRNKIPYRAVSRTRTVRPGNRSLVGRTGRRWARIRLSSRRQCPDQGLRPCHPTSACPAGPNNGITASVRPMLWRFP